MKKQNTKYQLINIVLLIFLCSYQGQAQFKGGLENFKLLDVKLGYSIPVGDYASTTGNDSESGYATPGLNVGAGYYYMFSDIIGLGGSLGLNFQGYDASARTRTIYENDPSAISVTVESSNYTNMTLTVGPVINKRFSEEWSWLIRAEVGMLFTFRPEQEFTIVDSEGTQSLSINGLVGSSYALYGGTAIRYHASETVAFSVFADYFYGAPKYDYVSYQSSNWIEIKGKQDIMYLNIGLELTFIIGY